MRRESTPSFAPRLLSALWPSLAAVATLALCAQGAFATLSGDAARWPIAAASALALALGVRAFERWRLRGHARAARRARIDVELTLGAFAAGEILVHATGAAASRFAPALYVLAVFAALWHGARRGVLLVLVFALADLALAAAHGAGFERGLFIAGCGLLAALGERIARARPRDRRPGELLRFESRAGASDEPTDLATAAERAHGGLAHVLELTHCALRPHALVLFWVDDDGRSLSVREALGASERLCGRPLRAGEGLLGGVLKHGAPVVLPVVRDRERLGYYEKPVAVQSVLAVPVREGEKVRGVLLADRVDGAPFDATDELLLAHAAREIARAEASERLFARLAEARARQERFYRASESFREALTFQDVHRVATQAAREVASWDFAAVTRQDGTTGEHVVACVLGEGDARLEGSKVDEAASLCGMAVKNRHELPAYGDAPQNDVPVFSPRGRLRGFESLIVLPLIARGVPQGTLVLAARRPGAFPEESRAMLRVIANQAAGALEHAAAYARLETLATTDGLTGLLNHRHFEERATELLARADRMSRPACLILCDVDHFKKVNDTYGHPVGDMVLREVGRLLASCGRKIDLVARYGGEEFALLLEGTDEDGGAQVAERIRGEMATRVFRCEQGSFRVTMSFGVAAYPSAGAAESALVEAADQALYAAKRDGRNRTMRASASARLALRA